MIRHYYDKTMSRKENEYVEYIRNHKLNIENAWYTHKKYFESNGYDIETIERNIRDHDRSKSNKVEFYPYRLRFYPSEEEKKSRTQEQENEFNKAWLHHINNNPHHWNYWVFYDSGEDNPVIIDMDDVYIVEMIMDWVSMGYPYNEDNCMGWYNEKKNEIIMSDNTKEKLEMILNDLFGGNE